MTMGQIHLSKNGCGYVRLVSLWGLCSNIFCHSIGPLMHPPPPLQERKKKKTERGGGVGEERGGVVGEERGGGGREGWWGKRGVVGWGREGWWGGGREGKTVCWSQAFWRGRGDGRATTTDWVRTVSD